jgi:hypothetical protein
MRKTATVTIATEGRDKGKVFYLTEMPPFQTERWATRAFLALAKSGVSIPDDIVSSGFAGLVTLGVEALAGINYFDLEPLLEEMLQCVQIIPNPQNPEVKRSDIHCDIEEVSTILKLRKEVFNLHANFSKPAVTLTSTMTAGKRSRNM